MSMDEFKRQVQNQFAVVLSWDEVRALQKLYGDPGKVDILDVALLSTCQPWMFLLAWMESVSRAYLRNLLNYSRSEPTSTSNRKRIWIIVLLSMVTTCRICTDTAQR